MIGVNEVIEESIDNAQSMLKKTTESGNRNAPHQLFKKMYKMQ